MAAPTLKSLLQRHRRARSAANAAFWQLFDTPAARAAAVHPVGLFLGGGLHSHAAIDAAAADLIARCKTEGRFAATPGCGPKLKPEHLETIATAANGLHQEFNIALEIEIEANAASGHTAVAANEEKARRACFTAFVSLCEFVRTKATAREVGAFANYILAAANNDFMFHLDKRTERGGAVSGIGFEELLSKWDDSTLALRVVQQTLAPLPNQTRAKLRAIKARK